jgi:hypothetical protein
MKTLYALLALAESVEDIAFYAMRPPGESMASVTARAELMLRSQG